MERALRLKRSLTLSMAVWSATFVMVSVFLPFGAEAQDEIGLTSAFSDLYLTRHLDKKIALHGYTSFQYFDQEGENGTFDQHIFEPFFGYQVNDRVLAKLIIEFEHAPEPQGGNTFAEVFIEQAEVALTLKEGTTVGFGAIIVPFGLENYLHAPPDNRLVSRPPLMHGENAIIQSTWTDVGIQFTHDVSNLGMLDLYVINGSAAQGKDERGRDTKGPNANSGKSFGAEIQATQLYPGSNIGLSGVIGPHDKKGDLDSWRLGVHALFDTGLTYLRAEYLFGTDEGLGQGAVFEPEKDAHGAVIKDEQGQPINTKELQTRGKDRDVKGFYAIVSQTILLPVIEDRLDLNVRYSNWTTDDKQRFKFSELAFGARYRLFTNTHVKAEQQLNKESGNAAKKEDDLFSLQLTVLF